MTVPSESEIDAQALDGELGDDRLHAAPTAQAVSPAIMAAKAGAIGMVRRRQAKLARAPESPAAMPMGMASGTLWKIIIPAPARPKT